MTGSWHITPKGKVLVTAIETGLVEDSPEGIEKFEIFWAKLKKRGVLVFEQGDEQARKRHDTIVDIVRHILFALLCLLAGLLGRSLRL